MVIGEVMQEFNYNSFFEEIEEKLTLHSHDLDRKIFEAINVQNTILKQYVKEKTKLIKLESNYNRVFGQKFNFYRYESDIRCENKDVALFYVKQDEEVIKITEEYEKQKVIVEYMEKYLKRASNIGFDIKNIIDYLRYMNGN